MKTKTFSLLIMATIMLSFESVSAQAMGAIRQLNDQNMPITLGEMPRALADKVNGVTVYKMPSLPYALSDLSPFITAQTMLYHYGKHTLAYMENTNRLMGESEFKNSDIVDVIRKGSGALYNNAAQFWNHAFFFLSLKPLDSAKVVEPMGDLAEALEKGWGSIEKFKQAWTDTAVGVFGSGWVWLFIDKKGHLQIKGTKDAGNPIREGGTPILCIDVWEHAYYLDYQNRRKDYVKSWFKMVNWEGADWIYRKVKKSKK